MKSFREPVERVFLQTTFILSMKAKVVYVLAILISIFISLSIVYRIQAFIAIFMLTGIVLIEFVLLSIANTIIDELRGGEAQVYLATGLSRLEYVVAWIMASIVYPTIALLFSLLIPVLIMEPDLLFKPIVPTPYVSRYVPTMLSYALAVSIQVLNNVSLSLALGLATRRKSLSILLLAVITILLPILLSILIAMFSVYYYDYVEATKVYYILIPFTPIYTRTIFSDPRNYVPEYIIFTIPFAVALIGIALIMYYAESSMEV